MAPPTIATNKIIPNMIKNICHQNHHSQLWQVNRKSLFGHFKTFLGKTTVSQVVQSLIASWKKFGNDSYIHLQNSSFPQVLQQQRIHQARLMSGIKGPIEPVDRSKINKLIPTWYYAWSLPSNIYDIIAQQLFREKCLAHFCAAIEMRCEITTSIVCIVYTTLHS